MSWLSIGNRTTTRLSIPGQAVATGRGIVYMLLGSAFLTANDAAMKWLIADYPVGEMLFVRGGAVALGVGLALWHAHGAAGFRVYNLAGQSLRAFAMVAGSFLFVGGLVFLPLADAIAVSFAGPLFTTALAVPFLGERVGWRRWLAVLIGFGGVLLMTRPSGEVVQWAILLPLGACLTGALRDIVTRKLTATDATLTTLFYTTAAVAVGGLATLPWGWNVPAPGHLALLLGSAALMGIAHYLQIEAFRLAEAAAIVPFRYSSLLWALLLGYLLWGELPPPVVGVGALIVVGAGLYIWYRERQLGR
jgi:drug/metabolite transporter (DMT)-like permease